MPDAEAATPLAGVFPPRLVARLHRKRFEGTLRLHGGGATRVIYFRQGEIASAASNADEDRLPNILIREGRLTGPQVEMARAKQRPGVSLGKTLIELGFLTPAELLQGARRQVRQILAAAFALREGTSQESPGPLPPEVTVLGLPVRRLIFDALLEAGDRQTVVQEMGSMETVYRTSGEFATALPTLRLDPQHEEVARLVDGQATLREISGRVRLDDLTVSKVVLALEILGLVEQESPSFATSPPGRRIPVISEEPEEAPVIRLASESWGDAAEPATPPRPAEPPPEPARPMFDAKPRPVAVPPPAASVPYPPSVPDLGTTPDSGTTTDFGRTPEARTTPDLLTTPYPGATSEPDSGMVFEEDDETPPPPPGELPAFAAPPNAPTGWSVNPETGEKVHLGPVELTFDGPVVPPQPRGVVRGRLVLFGGAGLLAVAAVVAFVVLRGDGATGDAVPAPEEIAARAAGADAASGGAGTETGAASGEAGSPAPATRSEDGADPSVPDEPGAPDDPATPESGDADAPGKAEAPHAAPAPIAAAPPAQERATPAPNTAPAQEEPAPAPPAERGAAAGTVDFGLGQRLLDAGTIDRAVQVFQRAIAPIPAGRFTLQTMIACEADTVRKARAGTRPDAGLFVLPVPVRDRSCFRVLWGVFETKAAAEAARDELPEYFAGVSPAVVAIDRLRSSS